ncbi:unnamed protein product [Owenia fusiformis]|uniref:Uncharacterized protein n=1 Tax=Owenia fusiformis TaxID=6347 RepID=A0A8J1XIY3_OWEFU|nr:unnamed protein product [Owenia fusiformis]
MTCWHCKRTGHRKAFCNLYKATHHFCSRCNLTGHRDKDHPTTPAPTPAKPKVNSVFVQANIKPVKCHNKYAQAATVDMDIYTRVMADYKRIESELFGQKHGNDIYRAKIQTLQSETADLKSRIKSQKKQIVSLEKELHTSQAEINALSSQKSEYSKLIQKRNAELKENISKSVPSTMIIPDYEHTSHSIDFWKLGFNIIGMGSNPNSAISNSKLDQMDFNVKMDRC